jgi:CDP-diacylglycerol--serine O-phosphatidyltransferase
MVVLSFLMVSNVPYYSFKRLKFSRHRAMRMLVVVIVLVLLIAVYPQNIFFVIFTVYALSGFFILASNFMRKKRGRKKGAPKPEVRVSGGSTTSP